MIILTLDLNQFKKMIFLLSFIFNLIMDYNPMSNNIFNENPNIYNSDTNINPPALNIFIENNIRKFKLANILKQQILKQQKNKQAYSRQRSFG